MACMFSVRVYIYIYIYLYILVGAYECLRGGRWYFFQYDPNFRIMYIVFTDLTELSYSILDQYIHFKMLNAVFHGEGRHLQLWWYKLLNDIKHHVLSSRYSPCVQFNFTCWNFFNYQMVWQKALRWIRVCYQAFFHAICTKPTTRSS